MPTTSLTASPEAAADTVEALVEESLGVFADCRAEAVDGDSEGSNRRPGQ